MFCQNCGTQIQPGQQLCSKCAMPLTGYMMPQKGRLERHVHLLGIFWIAYSALFLLAGAVLMIIANVLFGPMGRVHEAPPFLQPLLSTVSVFILIKAALGISAGWGLLQHRDWARVLSIVLAIFSLFNLPFGTALGIYTLWVLLARDADDEYRALTER